MTDQPKAADVSGVGSPDLFGGGNDLYRRVIAYDYGDDERNQLMAEVWRDTPWMVDAYTGGWHNNRQREIDIRDWCTEQFGPEAWPIHGRKGNWHRGGATIHGWTWMGFATEDILRRFNERWPPPNAVMSRPAPEHD